MSGVCLDVEGGVYLSVLTRKESVVSRAEKLLAAGEHGVVLGFYPRTHGRICGGYADSVIVGCVVVSRVVHNVLVAKLDNAGALVPEAHLLKRHRLFLEILCGSAYELVLADYLGKIVVHADTVELTRLDAVNVVLAAVS